MFPTAWAKQCSATSKTTPVSPAHVLNEVLNPWTVTGRRMARASAACSRLMTIPGVRKAGFAGGWRSASVSTLERVRLPAPVEKVGLGKNQRSLPGGAQKCLVFSRSRVQRIWEATDAKDEAAVFVKPGRIALDEKPVPEIGPLDALVRTRL